MDSQTHSLENANAPIVVFGEGSAAVFLIAQLVKRNETVVWAIGSGSKLLPVMPYVKSELALGALLDSQKLVSAGAVFAQPVEKGTFHRVFRNKAFKMPSWKRTANLESQKQAFEDLVWAPEQTYLGLQEFRMAGINPAAIELELRSALENDAHVKKVANAPVIELEVFEHGGKIQFANGFITEFKQFYFCDSLTELKALPKLAPVFKHQLGNAKMGNRMSALQVVFHHSVPLRQEVQTGIVVPMNRDSGETFDRDVMGYFIDSTKSVWTVFMQMEEIEENHEIMKKLRRMKQSLNKAFDSPEFLPDGCKEFMATVEREQFRFEEGCLLIDGHFKKSEMNDDFVLLTDSFGFTAALERIAGRFDISAMEFTGDIMTETLEDSADVDSSEFADSIDAVEMPAHLQAEIQ
jgi:hypothetical protein